MRSPVSKLSLALLILIAHAGASRAQDNAAYTIDNYEMTIEAMANRSDVRVTMDISYLIKSGTKSTGFKYIGGYDAQELSGRDETGRPLRTSIDHERETKLNWRFNPTGPGKKRVIISFVMPKALARGASGGNELNVEWAGIFKVPVTRAAYRFVFPDDVERTLVVNPTDYANTVGSGKRKIEVVQTPLRQYVFKITFWPAISDEATPAPGRSSGRSATGIPLGLPIEVIFVIAGGIIAVVIGFIRKLGGRTRRVRSDSGSWWGGGGGCAGGSSSSSCSSSSCGSSCGGGGCGGGGCGG